MCISWLNHVAILYIFSLSPPLYNEESIGAALDRRHSLLEQLLVAIAISEKERSSKKLNKIID